MVFNPQLNVEVAFKNQSISHTCKFRLSTALKIRNTWKTGYIFL
jgi:hypothetical protein